MLTCRARFWSKTDADIVSDIANPISATIDFARDGVQHGFLSLPHSHNDSAWGAVMIPVTQVKNGDGPTALLTGGNHGDEYEGPIALTKLRASLAAADVHGRIIIVPAMNYPAFRAAARVSPIDGGNLNRSFPGDPRGSATQKIADYFTRTLLPMADYVLDIHAGGKTLDFVPLAAMHRTGDLARDQASEAAMLAFGAPYAMYMTELDPAGLYDTEAEAQGKVFVTTELGGGTVSPFSVAIAERGTANFLRHVGVLAGTAEPTEPPRLLDMDDPACFVQATAPGIVEPCVKLGTSVWKDDVLARVWSVEDPSRAPDTYVAGVDGILASRHFPSRIEAGDCLAVVAELA